jgi:hypothetical protein
VEGGAGGGGGGGGGQSSDPASHDTGKFTFQHSNSFCKPWPLLFLKIKYGVSGVSKVYCRSVFRDGSTAQGGAGAGEGGAERSKARGEARRGEARRGEARRGGAKHGQDKRFSWNNRSCSGSPFTKNDQET